MKTAWKILSQAAMGWVDHNATTHGAALAFFAMLSLAPLVVITVAIIGLVYGEHAARGEIAEQIEWFTGHEGAAAVQSVIDTAGNSGTVLPATLVGLGMLLFGASAVFAQVQASLNMIWGSKPTRGYGVVDFAQRRAISFLMTLGVGLVLLGSLVLSAWLAVAEKFVFSVIPQVSQLEQWLDFGLSFLVVMVLFALIFKLLPDANIRWWDVWAGAAITALLFLAGKHLIGLYLGKSAVASSYGAAGSFFAVLLWVYYSSLIFYFGAEITHAYAEVIGSKRNSAHKSVEFQEVAKKQNQT